MKNLLLSLLLLPLLAFGAGPGDLQESKWVPISVPSGPGSTMLSVHTATGASASGEFQNGVLAFSGGAFATGYGSLGSLLVWGGGHNDYGGNEVYSFDVATGVWEKVGAQSPSGSCNYTLSQWPDGKPCSEHTYDALAYSPTTNELFQLPGSSDYGTIYGTSYIDAFSLTNKAWTRKGRISNGVDLTYQHEAAMTAYDSLNNVIWWHGANTYVAQGSGAGAALSNQLKKISVTTGNTVSSYLGYNNGQNGNMEFIPNLNALILVDPRTSNFAVWDVATGTPVRAVTSFTGGMPGEGWGFAWDPIANKGVFYGGSGSSVVTLTPPANWITTKTGTWVFTTVTAAAGSASPTTATGTIYGRFSYAPPLCGFVAATTVNLPVYAYRLTGGAGPGCGGSPPADPPPAVSLTANPTSVNPGGTSRLTFSSSNTGNCTFQIGSGSVDPIVSPTTLDVTPSATTTYTYRCAGLLSQSATIATGTAQVIVNTGTGGTGDFATRCAAPGVVRCTSFDTDTDFERGVDIYPSLFDPTLYPVRDTTVKASGASSMRFTLPSLSDDSQTGYWKGTLWDSSLVGGVATDHFGVGETFYVQWRQRMDSNFRNTDWWGLARTIPKQVIMHPTFSSCTGNELTLVRYYDTQLPIMYTNCGAENLWENLPNNDFRMQQGPDIDCRYQSGPGPICVTYVADNWMTFMVRVSPGTFLQPATIVEAWMSVEGASPTQWIDLQNFTMVYEALPTEKLQMLQITPYMTGRSSSLALPVATTWYDDLIVSTQPIAWPSGGSATPPPTATLSASPNPVDSGSFSTLDWTSTNATDCQASGAWSGTRGTNGTQDTDPLTVGATYTLICSGTGGTSAPSTVNVGVNAAPPVINITANPTSVPQNGGSLIGWSVANATQCLASGGWNGLKNPVSGSQFSNALPATTTFTLTCTGAGGSNSNAVTVTVTTPQPVIDTLTASPNPVDYGARSTLTWTSTDATSCSFTNPFSALVDVDGTTQVQLTSAATVTLRCQNAIGSVSRDILIGVNPIPNATVTLTPVNPTITSGGSQLLTWTTTNALACSGVPLGAWDTAVAAAPAGGSLSVSPTTTTSYTVTCTAAAGASASDSTQVIVNSVTPDPVVTLRAEPSQITAGTAADLIWTVSNATTCTASGDWSGSKSTAGGTESTGNLAVFKTYELLCVNGVGGYDAQSVTVFVTAAPVPPATTISVSPTTSNSGDEVTVTWSCTNSTTATPSAGGSDPDWLAATALSGSRTFRPTVNTTYTMTCSDGVTPDVDSATVTVNAARTLSLTASPAIAFTNGSTTLTWVTGGPLDACIWLQGPYKNTVVAADDSVTSGTLTVPTTFELMCVVGAEVIGGFPPDFRSNPNFKIQSLTINVTPNTPTNSRARRRWWRFRR